MTAAVTPSREALLAKLSGIDRDLKGLLQAVRAGDSFAQLTIHIGGLMVDADEALRLAAKPADEGREAAIEECAKIADEFAEPMDIGRRILRKQQSPEWFKHLAATEIAKAIRALSTTGETKR